MPTAFASTDRRYAPVASADFISCAAWPADVARPTAFHDKIEDNPDRRKLLDERIRAGDYFGTVATLLDLVAREKEKTDADTNRLIKQIAEDLLYLHKHYRISKK